MKRIVGVVAGAVELAIAFGVLAVFGVAWLHGRKEDEEREE